MFEACVPAIGKTASRGGISSSGSRLRTGRNTGLSAAFHVSGMGRWVFMKRFLNIIHGIDGAGTWKIPGWAGLKTAVSILVFLVQVFVLLVSVRYVAFAAAHSRMTETYRDSGTGFDVMVKSASIKKTDRKKSSRRIKSGSVKLSKTSYKYDGHTKKPSVTVKFGQHKLKKNRDYTITYRNNRRRGTASVIVKGKGLYSGTVTKKFWIR